MSSSRTEPSPPSRCLPSRSTTSHCLFGHGQIPKRDLRHHHPTYHTKRTGRPLLLASCVSATSKKTHHCAPNCSLRPSVSISTKVIHTVHSAYQDLPVTTRTVLPTSSDGILMFGRNPLIPVRWGNHSVTLPRSSRRSNLQVIISTCLQKVPTSAIALLCVHPLTPGERLCSRGHDGRSWVQALVSHGLKSTGRPE
jgi:hypothetical protein